METQIFIAQLLGVVYLTAAVGFFLNPKYYAKLLPEVIKNKITLLYGGIAALVVGYSIIVAVDNLWVQSWEVLVTLIGWIALVKGVVLITMPETLSKTFKGMASQPNLFGTACVIMGGVFTYFGFFA